MKPKSFFHLAYITTIAFKGFDGALETFLGLTLWISGPDRIYALVLHFTAPELLEEPGSHHFMELLQHGASLLAAASTSLVVTMVTYLLVHGVLKLTLALVLLRGGGRWIYPVAVVILVAFIAFMSYHLAEHWSNWVLGFALFDTITLALVLNEWRMRTPRLAPSVSPAR